MYVLTSADSEREGGTSGVAVESVEVDSVGGTRLQTWRSSNKLITYKGSSEGVDG